MAKHKKSLDTDELYNAFIQVICHQKHLKKDIYLVYSALLSWINASRGIGQIGYICNYSTIEIFNIELAFKVNPPLLMELIQTLFLKLIEVKYNDSQRKYIGLAFNLDLTMDKRQLLKYIKQFVTFELYHNSIRFKCGVTIGSSCNEVVVAAQGSKSKVNRKNTNIAIKKALTAKAEMEGSAEDIYALLPETIRYLTSINYSDKEIASYRISKVGVEGSNIYLSEDIETRLTYEPVEEYLIDKLFSSRREDDILTKAKLTAVELHFLSAYFDLSIPMYSSSGVKYITLNMDLFLRYYPEYSKVFKCKRESYIGGKKVITSKLSLPLLVHTELYKNIMVKLRDAAEKMLV